MNRLLTVAIQGVRGSNHDAAAQHFFGAQNLEYEACASFNQLANALASGRVQAAVMAIENTIAGSIMPNYALLQAHEFHIVGELYLRISHCLMALPGQALHQLHTVRSHPMALMQCQNFLTANPHLTPTEVADTAQAAEHIAQRAETGVAAIAPAVAAELYGLTVLEKGIETDAENFTRFLVLQRGSALENDSGMAQKASISLQLEDKPGTLLRVLALFNYHHINLTKIHSVPIVGQPYHYWFHFDLEWSPGTDYLQALQEISHFVEEIKILGLYQKGEK